MDPNSSKFELALNYSANAMNWIMTHQWTARFSKKHLMEQEMKLTKLKFQVCSGKHQLGNSENQLGSLSDGIIRWYFARTTSKLVFTRAYLKLQFCHFIFCFIKCFFGNLAAHWWVIIQFILQCTIQVLK